VCSYLARAPLGTSYPRLVEQVRSLVARPEFPRPPALCIDATGVGRPVVDLFTGSRICAHIFPITITPGHEARCEGRWHFVPKKDLVGAVVSLLESRRLEFAGGLALAGVAKEELLNFRAKIGVGGNETLEAWRERDHDDLVLAVAIAAWLGLNGARPDARAAVGGRRPALDVGPDLRHVAGPGPRLLEPGPGGRYLIE
jgi:hypothetical protein